MKLLHFSILRLLIICAIVLQPLTPVMAQENMHSAATEQISLHVGDIFEILPVHDITDASYTWILTQDRSFLEASRAPSFRKRLIQPGTYTLYAEIASGDGSRRVSRTITLDYAARQPGTQINGNGQGDQLVQTEPAASADGKIAMAGGKQLVRLTPVNLDITPLSLDLDLNRDADGDGNTANDIQSSETFFHTDATPLYLWITDDPLTTHPISVTAALPEGARTQKLEILNEEIARAQGAVQSPVRIEAEQIGDRTYTFTAVFDNPDAAAGQLLYQWQFGDGQQSLITKSEHTYAEDGIFTVSLLIRNLRDGKEVASTSTSLNVAPTVASSAASQQTSSEPDETPNTGSGFSLGNMGRIIMLAALFLGSIAFGVLIIFLMGRLRKGKATLAEKLETIEQTMVKPATEEPAPLTIAPPVAVQPVKAATPIVDTKRVEPPPAIAQREQEQAVARPAPQPAPKTENTPAWLNTAPAPKQVTPQQPAPVQTPKPAPATPAPSQSPAWLQQPATPKATQAPAPQPAPTQQAKPAPAQNPTPAQQPKPATPAASQTPAWLQQPSTPVTPKPATPAPVVQPKPAAPASSAPIQTPKPEAVQPPAPAPVQTSKPAIPATQQSNQVPYAQVSKPAPAPAAAFPNPAPVPTAVTPVPAQPKPTENPAPVEQKPAVMDIPAADQPIAIIRAESLNPQNEQGQQNG